MECDYDFFCGRNVLLRGDRLKQNERITVGQLPVSALQGLRFPMAKRGTLVEFSPYDRSWIAFLSGELVASVSFGNGVWYSFAELTASGRRVIPGEHATWKLPLHGRAFCALKLTFDVRLELRFVSAP